MGSWGEQEILSSNAMETPMVPFVTILTPVYNGEKYLAECIESVVAQTFSNWEYVIVNNCSTDRSLMIAESYARRDHRIKVCTNSSFVGVIENHNIAFSLVGQQSRYCKLVSADDWIYPNCVERMVDLAERNLSIGIVGSYQLRNKTILWEGVPRDAECMSGREVCRKTLLEGLAIFGPPTSNLFRADLVRNNQPFYSTSLPYADTCAFYDYLEHSDFGFVHEVLSVERMHEEQSSTKSIERYEDLIAAIDIVLKYGPMYLTDEERTSVLDQTVANYYKRLGGAVVKLKGKSFWSFHATRMAELGRPISWGKVALAAIAEILKEMREPQVGCKKLAQALKGRLP